MSPWGASSRQICVSRKGPTGSCATRRAGAVSRLRCWFVVTELIVAELATRTRAIAGAEQAGRVVRSLLDSRRHELIFVDLELLRAALDRLVRFADKRLSLTDCASFELMDRLSIDTAFT